MKKLLILITSISNIYLPVILIFTIANITKIKIDYVLLKLAKLIVLWSFAFLFGIVLFGSTLFATLVAYVYQKDRLINALDWLNYGVLSFSDITCIIFAKSISYNSFVQLLILFILQIFIDDFMLITRYIGTIKNDYEWQIMQFKKNYRFYVAKMLVRRLINFFGNAIVKNSVVIIEEIYIFQTLLNLSIMDENLYGKPIMSQTENIVVYLMLQTIIISIVWLKKMRS